MPNTIAAVNSVNATSAGVCDGLPPWSAATSSAAVIATRMPTPEIGEFDAPIRPAM